MRTQARLVLALGRGRRVLALHALSSMVRLMRPPLVSRIAVALTVAGVSLWLGFMAAAALDVRYQDGRFVRGYSGRLCPLALDRYGNVDVPFCGLGAR